MTRNSYGERNYNYIDAKLLISSELIKSFASLVRTAKRWKNPLLRALKVQTVHCGEVRS